MRSTRSLAVGLAAALAACGGDAPPPVPRLTHLDLPGATALLGGGEHLLVAGSDRAVAPAQAGAWGIEYTWNNGSAGLRSDVVESSLTDAVEVAPGLVLLAFRPLRPPPGAKQDLLQALSFLREAVLLDRATGSVRSLPFSANLLFGGHGSVPGVTLPPMLGPGLLQVDGVPPAVRLAATYQADAAGRLHFIDAASRLMPIHAGEPARPAFPVSAVEHEVGSFAFDDAGPLAYTVVGSTLGLAPPAAQPSAVAVSAPGQPLAVLDVAALLEGGAPAPVPLGVLFHGRDGHVYLTRSLDDAGQTTDLLRLDGGAFHPVSTWQGAPRGLRVAPLPVGGGLVFLQDEAVVYLADPASPPAVHALGATVLDARVAGDALWIVEGTQVDRVPAGTAVRRWTADGVTQPLAPVAGQAVGRLVPLSATEALVSVTPPAGQAGVVRLRADGTSAPADLGGAPLLGGAWLR